MRFLFLSFLVLAFAGCVSDAPVEAVDPEPFPLQVYRHAWPGASVFVEGSSYGMAFSVFNPSDRDVSVGMFLSGVGETRFGPISYTEGLTPIQIWAAQTMEEGQVLGAGRDLAAGESTVFLAQMSTFSENNLTARFVTSDPLDFEIVYQPLEISWTIDSVTGSQVDPGHLVQTQTVGLWTNGTSFYTNNANLLNDPLFPAGGNVVRSGDTTDLPIYVFNQDRSEQPLGSADSCYFTTITGYNDLLKTQADRSTGVKFIMPSDGYTQDGNEGHLLYGDALIFLNQVTVLERATTLEDELPNPNGACFDATRVAGKVAAQLPFSPL